MPPDDLLDLMDWLQREAPADHGRVIDQVDACFKHLPRDGRPDLTLRCVKHRDPLVKVSRTPAGLAVGVAVRTSDIDGHVVLDGRRLPAGSWIDGPVPIDIPTADPGVVTVDDVQRYRAAVAYAEQLARVDDPIQWFATTMPWPGATQPRSLRARCADNHAVVLRCAQVVEWSRSGGTHLV